MSRTRTNNHHLGSGFNFRKVLLFIVMLLALQAVLVQADCKKGTIMSDSGLPVLEQFPPGEVHYYGEDSLQYGELHLPEGRERILLSSWCTVAVGWRRLI